MYTSIYVRNGYLNMYTSIYVHKGVCEGMAPPHTCTHTHTSYVCMHTRALTHTPHTYVYTHLTHAMGGCCNGRLLQWEAVAMGPIARASHCMSHCKVPIGELPIAPIGEPMAKGAPHCTHWGAKGMGSSPFLLQEPPTACPIARLLFGSPIAPLQGPWGALAMGSSPLQGLSAENVDGTHKHKASCHPVSMCFCLSLITGLFCEK